MRNKNLDNAKLILTLLMVLYHIQYMADGKNRFEFMLVKNLGDCVVPAFTIISAFLFWCTVADYQDLKGKILRRMHSLLIPYILWNLLNTVLINVINGKRGVSILRINIIRDIMMWNSSPHFWYLFMLMFWTVLSPLLLFIYKRKWGIALLVIMSGGYLLYMGDAILHSRYIYILYVWAGVAGFHCPNLVERILVKNEKHRRIILLCAVVVYVGLYFTYGPDPLRMGIQVWLYGIRALALLIILMNVPVLRFAENKLFNYSFWLFAVHYWLDAIVSYRVIGYVHFALLYQIITFSVVVVVALLLGVLLNRWFPVVYYALSGQR